MSVIRRIVAQDFKYKFQFFQKLHTFGNEKVCFSTLAVTPDVCPDSENVNQNLKVKENKTSRPKKSSASYPPEYRFIYQEFLPDPNPQFRHPLKEKMERKDMLARRSLIDIPEFYVGSILAVTHSDIHAPGKTNRFVGICILKKGCGLRHRFLLRNVIDDQGVEVGYDLYDPTIQKIECLRLEKRLDEDLRYLRDAPTSFSTVPFDLEAELITDRKEVPVNKIQIPLLPQPWGFKYELMNLKGIKPETIVINRNRTEKCKKAAKPWEKYDLMKIYRETIPEEEQNKIFDEISVELDNLHVVRQKKRRARVFSRPKKTG